MLAEDESTTRSSYGGSFEGTLAYDPQVGYDAGQADDNGQPASFYQNNRGQGPRTPGKRSDPGDLDYFHPYYQTKLYNDRSLGDYDDLDGYLEFHGGIGRERYWRSRRFYPLAMTTSASIKSSVTIWGAF